MSIDRNKARHWSANRIREEITDLRHKVTKEKDDIEWCWSELGRIRLDNKGSRESLSESIEKSRRLIENTNNDIAFLKSLL